MASASSGWKCTHTASTVSSSNTSVTIRVTCYWQNDGWNYDIKNVSAWVYCNGSSYQVKKSGTVNAPSNHGKYSMGSHDFTVSKGTSAKSVSCSAKITSSSSYVSGTKSSSASSVSVSAKPSYKISYNANGGSGAPGAQTKWYGSNIKLSSTKPSRTGYSFQGWATSASGGVAYAAGATYSANAAVTLYAVWKANTYTVSYNANGGTGAPSNQTKTYGVNLTLSSTKPTRTNYNFKGWGTSAGSTTVAYAAGATYTANAAITLYAVWELAYTAPRITNLTVDRCNSSGTIADEGTYALVKFNWVCDKTVSAVKIEWGTPATTGKYPNSVTVSASGTSGTVSQVIGSGKLDTSTTYEVLISVDDTVEGTSIIKTLSSTRYAIDFKAGGRGIAVGKAAEQDELFDVGYAARFRSDIITDGKFTAYSGSKMLQIYPDGSGNAVWYKSDAAAHVFSPDVEVRGVFSVGQDATIGGAATVGGTLTANGNAQVKGTLTANGSLYVKNDASIICKDTGGTNRHLIGISGSNNVYVGSSDGGGGNAHIYGGNDVRFYSNRNSASYKGTGIYVFREQSGSHRTVLKPATSGGGYLGTTSQRWNTAFFTNAITASDLKEKEVIEDFDMKSRELIMGLTPIAYHRIGDGDTGERVHYGFGAQTVSELIQSLEIGDLAMVQASMIENDDEYPYHGEEIQDEKLSWGLNYNELIAPLVATVQAQQREINELRKIVKEFKGREDI